MNFKEFFENAVTNLAASTGEAVKNMILQVLEQPAYAQWKIAFQRLQSAPQLYQAFLSDVAKESNNTYRLAPAKYIQLIQKHSLKAVGTKLPPQIPVTQPQPQPPQV